MTVGAFVLAIDFAPVPNKGALALGLAVVALAAGVGFYIRQRRTASPLYDLDVATRRIFWVAACAGIIVFGSLMAAMFIGQQFLQNVLGYSTVEAGASILPAAILMVLVAPRSAKLIEAKGSRFTLLTGYVFVLLGFVTMLLLWNDGISYWKVTLGYALVGIGVGFAGTPRVSLPHRVGPREAGRHGVGHLRPPTRPRRRHHAVDPRCAPHRGLRSRDDHGRIAGAPNAAKITDTTQDQLQQSFAGAENVAGQFPQYAAQITAAAKSSFLDGANWAYTAGIIAVLAGATLVFFMFPKQDEEIALLDQYHAMDVA